MNLEARPPALRTLPQCPKVLREPPNYFCASKPKEWHYTKDPGRPCVAIKQHILSRLESLIEDETALDETTPPPTDPTTEWKKRTRRRKPKPSGKMITQTNSKGNAHETASTSKTLVGYFDEGKPLQSKWCPQCERELLLAIPLADPIKMCHNVVIRKENQGPSHTEEVRADPNDIVDAAQVALDTSMAVQKHESITLYAFTCPFCEKGFHAEANMANHIAQLDEQSPTTKKPPSRTRVKAQQRSPPYRRTCHICGEICKTVTGLQVHLHKIHKKPVRKSERVPESQVDNSTALNPIPDPPIASPAVADHTIIVTFQCPYVN
ncbi:hypothetical protein TNCV_701931 [Trichonephila clavipes]|nr:hypothetical protein TNCV_701931 [Trichonephila clavipes]